MNKSLLNVLPENTPFGFDDLLLMLLREKTPVHIFQYDGYWLDIGGPDDYDKANEDIQFLNSLV